MLKGSAAALRNKEQANVQEVGMVCGLHGKFLCKNLCDALFLLLLYKAANDLGR